MQRRADARVAVAESFFATGYREGLAGESHHAQVVVKRRCAGEGIRVALVMLMTEGRSLERVPAIAEVRVYACREALP